MARCSSSTSGVSTLQIFLILVTGWAATSTPPLLFTEAAITQDFLSFTFFYHDNLLQPPPTNNSAFLIVQPLQPPTFLPNDTTFGGVVVFDDSLTLGPDPSSLEIGRGRGVYIFDVNNSTLGAGLEFIWTAEFNEASGYGAGSTLTFKGLDRLLLPVRESAIVGGTGKFRLARGWTEELTYAITGKASAILNITANVFYGLG